jgi:hypothetical protein
MSKNTDRYYFTQNVDDAIIKYNTPNCTFKDKNILYNQVVYPAFDKLAENLINTYKVTYIDLDFEDLKHDLVVFLTEKLDRFSPDSGKAFSYFTKIGINYLIGLNTKHYKKAKERVELTIIDEERNLSAEITRSDYLESLNSFIDEWVNRIDHNLEKLFSSKSDRAIVDSVLELFRQRKLLHTYNKKLLYILIRERADVPTSKITNVVNFLKKDFEKGLKNFLKRNS